MRIRLFVLLSIIKCVKGKFDGFIVGGKYAESIEAFPHVAFLLLKSNDGQEFNCGSSILNQFIIITAAHCVSDGIQKIIATVGNLNKFKGKRYHVQQMEIHRDWNEYTTLNDIAMCKLKQPLVFGKAVKRVLVLKSPPQTSTGMIAGWGAIDEDDWNFPSFLKYTGQKLWTYNMCKAALNSKVPQGTICGGERQAKTAFCSKGDSGSGLLIRNNILIGLVSFKFLKISRSLVVYTDVAYHYDWMKHAAARLSCHLL